MSAASPGSTQPQRLRIGACFVDVALREIQAGGNARPRRLTPKAMAVLTTLAARPGQVVSRDELLAAVWPDSLPTNDVVTQAITQLRKAFSADADRSDYIETIAKTGYRLLAPVSWEQGDVHAEEGAAVTVAPAPLRQGAGDLLHVRASAWRLALVCVLLLVTASALVLIARAGANADAAPVEKRVSGTPALPYRLITSGGAFDLTPTLSPDASMVAYTSMVSERAETSILVKTTNNAPPRVLSRPGPTQSDRLPAWSPDGRDIAFARQGRDGSCRVMVTAANGAADEREVARCDGTEMLSFSWAPDGTSLLFGTMTGRNPGKGLRTLDLRSGQWRALAYAVGNGVDYSPRYSPDGKWIAFVRNPQMGDLWLMPASGGTPEPLTQDDAEIRGWDWLPDSSGVVFGRRVDSQLRLYQLDLDHRYVRDVGVSDAQMPVIAAGKLAFVQRKPGFGIYKVVRDPVGGAYHKQHLFASTGRDAQSIVSPDGRQIVFSSDRSGEYALWWADLSDPDSLKPIEGMIPDTRQPPDWSPDSHRLLVVARDGQGKPSLREVTPVSNRVVALPLQESRPLQAVYLPDPRRILVLAADGSGNAMLSLYDRSITPWRRLESIGDVSQMRFDQASGTVLFTRFSADGLWRIDPSLARGSIVSVDSRNPSRWRYRSWTVGRDGAAHYLFQSDACATYEEIIGQVTRDGHCLDAVAFSALNGFSADHRDGALYVPLASEDGSEIGFMDLPKVHAGFLGAIPRLLFPLKK